MSIYKRGKVWWYKFSFAGQLIRESANTASKTVAREAEKQCHRELELGYNNIRDKRSERVKTCHWPRYTTSGSQDGCRRWLQCGYGVSTLAAEGGCGAKTVNEEIGFLLRLLGNAGDAM